MKSLPRSTPAVLLGVALLLILTTTGGAVAGSLVTGKQIKNNTVTTADIKNGTLTAQDLSPTLAGAVGAQGPAGATGAKGDKGDKGAAGTNGGQGDPGIQGPRGYSAWDTIPGGVTVSGVITYDASTTGSTASDMLVVNLPGAAPLQLGSSDVNFAPDSNADTTDDDADCTGSVGTPTAPQGTVCIYLNGTAQMGGLMGSVQLLPNRAFRVSWTPKTATGGQDMYLTATWAYTAPIL